MKAVSMGLLSLALAGSLAAATHLKVGDKAPDFTLPATTGDKVTLSDYVGKGTVVVGFFPAAFTGGCTKEAKAYQEGIAKFEAAGARVFLISTDNIPSLRVFAGQVGASYPMLSDFLDRQVSKAYGVLMEDRGIANRATFVIDTEGKIQHVEEGGGAVDPAGALTACQRAKN